MSNQVVANEKNITEDVLNRVNDLKSKNELLIPPGYSPENALKSAYLILQETLDKNKKPVLQSCSKASIANALLDMVIQGLSPSKKQCYFVAYGDRLQLMRSYMGTVAVTKRLKGVVDVKAHCIYEGDEFEMEFDVNTATMKVVKFNHKFENVDTNKLKGVFASVVGENGILHTEVMNMNQIRNAWNQGYTKGVSGAHKNFTDEMAKKTVINRACKMFANTSDDSDLLIEAFNNSDREIETKEVIENVDYEVKKEIEEKANTKTLDIPPIQQEENIINANFKEVETAEQNTFDGPGF